jgi:hypothetical protein
VTFLLDALLIAGAAFLLLFGEPIANHIRARREMR